MDRKAKLTLLGMGFLGGILGSLVLRLFFWWSSQ